MINVDYKDERVTLLDRQKEIEWGNCEGCKYIDASLNCPRRCEGCPLYTELRNIGRRLDKIVQLERKQRSLERMAFTMSKSEYKELHAAGKKDKEIIALKKTTPGQFNKWKKESGLVEAHKSKVDNGKKVSSRIERVSELESLLRQANNKYYEAVNRYEKEIADLSERLQKANSANAQLTYEVVSVDDNSEQLQAELTEKHENLEAALKENAILRDEALSLRKQITELSQLATTETAPDCDENLVNELYEKIHLLNDQLLRQATQATSGLPVNYAELLEEEELFQTQLLRKLLSEREQRIALKEENRILRERVGLV